MEKLTYKTFTWPQNPRVYREEYIREPEYMTENKVTSFTGMGAMKRIITGEGVFWGPSAYSNFRKLAALFGNEDPGDLEHPIWGTRYCYFTGLELTQEPKEYLVSYRFTFTCAQSNGTVPK